MLSPEAFAAELPRITSEHSSRGTHVEPWAERKQSSSGALDRCPRGALRRSCSGFDCGLDRTSSALHGALLASRG
eukprot:491576-Alexandrium_andersonii.AAC.1